MMFDVKGDLMVYRNLAKVYCELCGSFIGEKYVFSPSKNRQIKIIFGTCEKCRREFNLSNKNDYSYYDTLGLLYEYAKILTEKPFTSDYEKDMLRKCMNSLDEIFIPLIERGRKRHFTEILDEMRDKLHSIEEIIWESSEIVGKYRDKVSIIEVLEKSPAKENSVIKFREYIRSKMKRSLR